MRQPRRYLLASALSAALSLGCALLFHFLGGSVDEQGVLHEPFALIPLGWMFLVAALYFAFQYWRLRNR